MQKVFAAIMALAWLGLVASPCASAQPVMTLLEQSRSASVDAFALWTSGGESDAQNLSDTAVGFGEFSAEPRADVSTRHSSADVQARHSSRILPLKLQATGSMAVDAFSTLTGQGSTAGGAANSRFALRFQFSEPIEFRIDGSLAATKASVTVELLGPGGLVYHRSLTDTAELMESAGVFSAGEYMFSAWIVGSCTAEEIETCRSAGYFNALLFLGDAATSTEASSFGALKALYD